ncbi:TonB-dependent receptor domain-containing protein, partial [Stenotrophomonas maltophilia]|uniref:TonB-dependent receptor domain-containing protein n=1 Tax=Stenotrophomonas maltophilia TaxID=40324 RepID=UPI0013D9DBB5
YTLATITQTQMGFYAQDQIKFGRLSLTLGSRYDTVNTGLDNHLTPSGSASSDVGRFTGRAALMYTTDFGLAPYV